MASDAPPPSPAPRTDTFGSSVLAGVRQPSPWQRWLPYAQLVRLPNVFTAMADIGLGALATAALPEQWLAFICLILASSCLYCSGMVWNDYFDLQQDYRERSYRPLPSGRVSLRQVVALGTGLMAAGVLFAGLADWRTEGVRWHSLWLALFLVLAIFLYNGWLKRTWAGPIGMGACRFLNVLLGLSVAAAGAGAWGTLLALTVGVYIVGVTWFARTEARLSQQNILAGAAGVLLAGVLLALTVPALAKESGATVATSIWFPYLLVAFGFFVGLPVADAIRRPVPAKVQAAVKRLVLGLVVLDAILATALAGLIGLVLLLLLIPATYLGRWVYST